MAESGTAASSSLLRTSCPFDREEAAKLLPFDVSRSIYLELTTNDEPHFSYVLKYISRQVKTLQSLRASRNAGRSSLPSLDGISDDELDDVLPGSGIMMIRGKGGGKGGSGRRNPGVKMPEASLGLGWHNFEFEHKEGKVAVHVLLQRVGLPVGHGPSFWSSIVLFIEGSDQLPLLRICQEAEKAATDHKENHVSLWRFDTQHHFWMRLARRLARSVDSIVLEEKVKKGLMDDLEWFLSDETRSFYAKHGIPYHRCYLFHGKPGTGKTSFIYALAGHLQRNLCFIQMDKWMTDDTLRTAMTGLPRMAMVVLEDVDALFTNHREADHSWSSLSFSGFINCLDGLGAPEDVVIFMTSNHPERLDPALMRPGRIDMKVNFKPPSRDVAVQYFLTFYPGAATAAQTFGDLIGRKITEKRVSMAQLQHFFLACNRLQLDADKAAQHIQEYTFEESGATEAWSRWSYG